MQTQPTLTFQERVQVQRHRIHALRRLLHTAVGEQRRGIQADLERETQVLNSLKPRNV